MVNVAIQDVLKNAVSKWGKRNFIYSRIGDKFIPKTFENTINDTLALAEGLLNLGLSRKHILIYGENSYEWIISDLAIMGFVGVTVAANKEWKQNDLENMIDITDAECIIYSNTKNEVIEKIKEKYDIKYISMQNDIPPLLENGYKLLDEKEDKESEKKNIEDMCKIVFTSGTTSVSKAVMLSQKNLFVGFDGLYKRTKMCSDDKIYLFLPLNHTYAGIYNLLACLYFGMELYLCSDTNKMFEELIMTKPTIFCGVPLVYERVYKMLGEETIEQAQVNKNEECIKKIQNIFGGNIRYLFCGGAKHDSKIRGFYKDIGFKMLEAYALTETASSLSIEYGDSKSTTSVGTILENIDVKFINIDKNGCGEILVKGDNIALGYYKNEDETKKVFDKDGYFHTGDIGYKDEDNQLFLIGRKRKVIVLKNGENIYPNEIEEIVSKNDGITKVKIFEKNDVINAIIYVVKDIDIDEIIKSTNEKLPTYKQIKDYEVIQDTVDKRLK